MIMESTVKHTIVALIQDHPGALNRAVSLFRRRGFNIHSIVVGPSETPDISRMTLVVEAEHVEQVVKQLYRIIEVTKVTDVTHAHVLQRELALLKVHAPQRSRPEVVALAQAFQARILDTGSHSMILELTDAPAAIDRFINLLKPFGLKELARTGRIAMVGQIHKEGIEPTAKQNENGHSQPMTTGTAG
jgi:acetolactate synthase-1/3 small subunit